MRILIADPHPFVRESLRMLLSDVLGLNVVGEAADGLTAVIYAAELRADLVLMDVMMPGIDGIEATRRILARRPDCRVVILTFFGERHMVKSALKAGARGYLLKNVLQDDLLLAIKQAMKGELVLHAGLVV